MVQKLTARSIKTAHTRETIIESARRLMRLYGYEGTSVQQICEEAQVSTGTFYHLFPSKHDVLMCVVTDSGSEDADACFDYEKDSPYKLALTYSQNFCRVVDSLSPETLFGVFFLSPGGNKLFYAQEHPTRTYLTTALKGFQNAGKLRADIDVAQMFNELFSCHLGMLYSSYTTRRMETFQADLEAVLKRLISAYMIPENT